MDTSLLKRLAHAVADYHETTSASNKAKLGSYLSGMRDAIAYSGGKADFTLNMHTAYHKVGHRPTTGSANTTEMKAWQQNMIDTYREMEQQ